MLWELDVYISMSIISLITVMILKGPGRGFAHLRYLFLANCSLCVEFQFYLCVTGAFSTSQL